MCMCCCICRYSLRKRLHAVEMRGCWLDNVIQYSIYRTQHTSLACAFPKCSRDVSRHDAASFGLGQCSACGGTALVVDSDQHAIRASHLEPTRVNEAQSRIEQFDMKIEAYEEDFRCGHRSSDGWRVVRVNVCSEYTTSDAVDFAAGRTETSVRSSAYMHDSREKRTFFLNIAGTNRKTKLQFIFLNIATIGIHARPATNVTSFFLESVVHSWARSAMKAGRRLLWSSSQTLMTRLPTKIVP